MGTYTVNINNKPKDIYRGHLKMGGTSPRGEKLSFTNYYAEKNGKPFFGICGEFHYSRCSYLYWEKEIRKIKACGVNIVSTYVFWNHHEEEEGIFNWEGDKNLRYFVDLCAKNDIYVILRIGPFCHGEVKNGGIPDWLYGRPFAIRSNSPEYLFYTKRFYNEIGRQVEGQMFKDNGPVIGVQLENEHMHASPPWEFMVMKEYEWLETGRDGAEHIKTLRRLAVEAGMEVPIYTCTGWGGASFPEGETLPLYGGYSFCPWVVNESEEHAPTNEYLIQNFHDNNFKCVEYKPPFPPEKYPYACCELGAGMACWYKYRFVVEPESVEAATLVKIAGGCNFIGYYMFHDGSNPVGKHGYLNERVVPKISYNFQAPLGEYGQIRESYKLLKPIFYFLKDYQETLCPMGTVVPDEVRSIVPQDSTSLRFAVRQENGSGFVFLINYQDHFQMKDIEEINLYINLPEEHIAIPGQGRGITLKKNVSAILPFNMDIEGISLKYSTTQYITSIADGEVKTYFFFAVEGMESEYCFSSQQLADIRVTGGVVNETGEHIEVFVKPGLDSVITLTAMDGTETRLCTLTRQQALGFWKFHIWGQDRVIISNADILAEEGRIEVGICGAQKVELHMCPPLKHELTSDKATLKSSVTGIFETFEFTAPQKNIALQISEFETGNCSIGFPEDMYSNVEDVMLQIDYSGNVGSAFVKGTLVSDNFCNGQIWEIGLRRIRPDVREHGMYIHIIPYKRGSDVLFDPAIKFENENQSDSVCKINSINAVPLFRINIFKA